MILLQTLLAFAVALGSLVVIHELGHYLVARWCGVKVLRFSVGMGKIVFSRRLGRDQTEWAISILPLGGYVKMLDAREQDVSRLSAQELQREFTRQNVWRRIAIVAAGPIANFILAITIFSALYVHGTPEPVARLRAVAENTAAYQAGLRGGELVVAVNDEPIKTWPELRWKLIQLSLDKTPARLQVQRPVLTSTDRNHAETVSIRLDGLKGEDLDGDILAKLGLALARPKALLGKVEPQGPAMLAGLEQGDLILEVNSRPIVDGLDFVELVRASAGKPLAVRGLHQGRDGAEFAVTVTPQAEVAKGHVIGRIKVELPLAPEMVVISVSPHIALVKAVARTWDASALTLKMLGKMVLGEVSWKNVTGPITIADYAGQTARVGAISYFSFIAFISISLGVMNLLPIPVLDGGLLLYYSLEVLTGRPVSERFGEIAQRAGMGILLTLMIVAVFNDIMRLMS